MASTDEAIFAQLRRRREYGEDNLTIADLDRILAWHTENDRLKAALDKARTWAREYRTNNHHGCRTWEQHKCEVCRTFDALPWAREA